MWSKGSSSHSRWNSNTVHDQTVPCLHFFCLLWQTSKEGLACPVTKHAKSKENVRLPHFFQLLARLGGRPEVGDLERNLLPSGPQQRDLVEFYGNEGSGKTQMLTHLIQKCILPASYKSIRLRGLQAGVILVDTDCHFSVLRLVGCMEDKIRNCVKRSRKEKQDFIEPSGEEIQKLIKESLGRLHVVKCSSSSQFILTLYSLEETLASDPAICFLFVDSISAFFWIDKSNGAENYSAQELNQRRVCGAINRLMDKFNIITIVSKPALFQKRQSDNRTVDGQTRYGDMSPTQRSTDRSTEHCEYLCKTWQKLVTHRFVFSRQQLETGNQLFSVKGGSVSDTNECVTANFYICEQGVLFVSWCQDVQVCVCCNKICRHNCFTFNFVRTSDKGS